MDEQDSMACDGSLLGTINEEDECDSTADDIISSVANNVILAINFKSSSLGWAYFSCSEGKLFIVEDVSANAALVEKYHAGWSIVENLIFQVKPTIVLLPARIEESIEEVLKAKADEGFRLDIRPSNEFSHTAAINRILSLKLNRVHDDLAMQFVTPDDNGDNFAMLAETGMPSKAALLDLSSRINLDKEISLGCAGAVISYTQKLMVLEDGLINHNDASLRINEIESFKLNDIMFVNSDTICSLQIFEDESHPNFHTRGSTNRHKEGLSLFGILNSTVTPFGHQLLKSWFLRPSLSLQVITERHNAVALFVRQDNIHITAALKSSLKRIKNIPSILNNLNMGKAALGDWKAILDFSFGCLKIRAAVSEILQAQNVKVVYEIMSTFDQVALKEVCELISSVIDFDMSRIDNRIVVKPTVDRELDELKRNFDGIEDLLSAVARRVTIDLPEIYSDRVNAIYFPQLGYLILVALDEATGDPCCIGEDWDYQFRSDTHAYFKSPEVRELDDTFGDMYGMICDREIEIVHALQVDTLKYSELLVNCCKWTAELDCLLSLAEAAQLYHYSRPTMTTENVIKIKKGRHPLYELTVPSFVDNDTDMYGGTDSEDEDIIMDESDGDEQRGPSALLLTGANYSGKSVYLKQVALIVYMSHIGSFVPAEFSKIGITDKILTRVMTRETVSKEQSAFMVDLQQVCLALQLCTNRSLFIIDEFGKGTESTDGAGLFGSLLEYLLSPESKRPKVLASTHYHELFENDTLHALEGLEFMHMQVLVDDDVPQIEDKITYLYRLLEGRSTSSFGICCAALNGVPEDITARAEDLGKILAKGEDIVTVCCKMSDEEVKSQENAELVARRFLKEEFLVDFNGSSQKKLTARAKLKRTLYGH
ncbi:muts domain V-domain-containing protein [Lipomyces orientalis]|uniref:Muts domain V-domain-containing protein n=1 Tax=Lipomyces orientalis TaxID=1233043 RepID=A0ACC3TQM3_9ASCO